jgi:hypothetical protein
VRSIADGIREVYQRVDSGGLRLPDAAKDLIRHLRSR